MAEIPDRTIALRGLIATVLAAVANAALVPVARALALAPGFEPIAYPPVIFLTALSAIAATFVFAVVVRMTFRPAWWFTRLAAGVLVLSFVPDLILLQAQPGATIPGVLWLMLMHVVAAVVIVGVLTWDVRPTKEPGIDE